jgi:lipoyl(octanoyl) transferase
MNVKDIGIVGYHDALALQRDTVRNLQAEGGEETLYLLEHQHVVTLGRNATMASLVASRELLALKGVDLVETDRGGDITYHGPGQLVGYPILALEEGRQDIRRYVSDVEEALIRTLAELGITGRRDPVHRGVWVRDCKIASVGIRISRWVTSHGFALNVSTDLSYFGLIVPCGIAGCRMTTISNEIGRPLEMATVKSIFVDKFCDIFERTATGDYQTDAAFEEGSTAHG